ncbi:Uncharacterized protein AXF42_Ash001164 [Apostasia shenzhenica]|uniref:Single-stranded DNA binding protein Ssb-like OB fold domain-containing protein n=1 Tax=Apostasia shenzhenica TaxID=1088818 RepID=A0A2I0AU44_9ASPA|nr:Uncharacterized protein AXF42_Ash001164 [Apostasia shenzhenica]
MATEAQQGGVAAKPAMRKPVFVKVDQLKPGTGGHTLAVKVIDSKTVLQKGRVASAHRQTKIAECVVGDETGTIVFTARNEQAGCCRCRRCHCTQVLVAMCYRLLPPSLYPLGMMNPGATVVLRNAKIDMFKGSMRLAVDKWGRVEVTEPASFTVKEENNLSLVEYELVNVVEE